MSLLHAHACKTRNLDRGSEEWKNLPVITCYERGSMPGGVWRECPTDDPLRLKPENKGLQYEDLWLNNPKELIEYYDYTFDEHFHRPTPAYLPRRDVWEYVLSRNNMYGELDNVKYNHTVLNSRYDSESSNFTLTVSDDKTGETKTKSFDRCIFAGGQNGKPYKPEKIMDLLSNFAGRYYHSVEATENFPSDVAGKRVMLIGDSNSAEDLTLRAIKHGVEHVYITSRSGLGDGAQMGSWPEGKVTIAWGVPDKLINENSFQVSWNEETKTTVANIDLVIMCTGYSVNQDMLDEDLRINRSRMGKLSEGWKMGKNYLSADLGEVSHSEFVHTYTQQTDLCRGLLISNPKMMHLVEYSSSVPLWDLELRARILLSYLTGQTPIPTNDEMVQMNQERLDEDMKDPWMRYACDMRYKEACAKLPEDHFFNVASSDGYKLAEYAYYYRWTQLYASEISALNYPVDFGDQEKLSPFADRFLQLAIDSGRVRRTVEQDESGKGCTFRDTMCKSFISLYTCTPSLPLPKYWLELKVEDGKPTRIMNLLDKEENEEIFFTPQRKSTVSSLGANSPESVTFDLEELAYLVEIDLPPPGQHNVAENGTCG
eukprot:CAMPEP_0195524956 /NCGR_PEP_ID=MMETSP0794_2-20130614/25091_1 /TAXON_ID=515487 /ORGANISM="Stephanopyxis turris, Strain CCMP 815" /LENGTH=598 /DNA_ID=CAMNT_0040655293 /DNA_START=204 /DNA_END=2001 /DNA_ORIENTATION=+